MLAAISAQFIGAMPGNNNAGLNLRHNGDDVAANPEIAGQQTQISAAINPDAR